MTNEIVRSFNGNKFYRFAVIKKTNKTATVQPCDVNGGLMGKPTTKRIKMMNGEPVIVLNRFETVYLTEAF